MTERRYLPPLPQDMERAPSRKEWFLMSVVAVLTLYVHTGDFPAAQATEEVVMDRAHEIQRVEERAKHYAAVVAGCMNGEVIVWTDPHTKMDMAAKCRVAEIGRMQ